MNRICFMFLLCVTFFANAQIKIQDITYIAPFQDSLSLSFYRVATGKVGLISKDSIVITEPIYNYIHVFDANLVEAGLEKKGRFVRGVINKTGEIIIPFEYDYLYYTDAVFVVEKNKKFGVLSTNNEEIVPIQYDLIRSYNPFILVVKQNKVALFVKHYGFVTDFIYDDLDDLDDYFDSEFISLRKNNETFLFDVNGANIYRLNENEKLEDVKNKLLIVSNSKTKSTKIINLKDQPLFTAQYESISFINDQLKVLKEGKYQIVNYQNIPFFSQSYDAIWALSNELYIVEENDKKGVYYNNELVLPLQYNLVSNVDGNSIFVENLNGKSGVYDFNLNVIVPEKGKILSYFNGDFLLKTDDDLEVFNAEKKSFLVLDKTFEVSENSVQIFIKQAFIVLKRNDKKGAIDYAGNIVIPFEYEDLIPIYASKDFIAKKENKFGIISEGNFVIKDFKYYRANLVKETVLFYDKNNKKVDFYPVRFE